MAKTFLLFYTLPFWLFNGWKKWKQKEHSINLFANIYKERKKRILLKKDHRHKKQRKKHLSKDSTIFIMVRAVYCGNISA